MKKDFITGEKFHQISNFIFSNSQFGSEDYSRLQPNFNIESFLKYDKNIPIIYSHTFYVKNLFEVLKNVDKKYILITHNSDTNIDESYKHYIDDNLMCWYSQNVDLIDDKIISLPIGLENEMWFKNINKKQKMIEILKTNKNHINLLYINHNINTNPKERQKPYEIFRDKKFATVHYGNNGVGFENYLHNLYNHKFVLSPKGNGIDTHRLWECLYLNVIPIEKRNINNSYYQYLPICFVDDWEEITEEFLNSEYIRITYNLKNNIYNLDKLNFSYWKNKIINSI